MKPREWRKSRKLTLEALAVKIGFAVGYLSEVERGVKSPSGGLLMAYHKISQGKVGPSDFAALKRAS